MNNSFSPLKIKYLSFISLSRFVFKIFICFFLFSQIIWAQYRFDSWDAEDGLPQNTVYAITQTRDGFLWLTTYDGLARFDGVRFTVFDKSNTKGINSNRFTSLYEDTEGVLWIGTEYGGLVRYAGGEFKTFAETDGLPSTSQRYIQQDNEGNLVVSTATGIFCLRGEKFEPCISSEWARYFRVYWGKSGTKWIFDKNGLDKIRNGNTIHYPIQWRENVVDEMQFFEDDSGDLWIGAEDAVLYRIADDGIIRYSREGERAEKGTVTINPLGNITGGDADGNIWFGKSSGGVVVFDPRTRDFKRFTTADGLSSNSIKSFFRDREGTLWIGTDNRGINRVTKQFIRTISDRDGMKETNVYPVLEDSAGNLWVGASHGLSRIKDGIITNNEQFVGVQALYEDREGRVWIGFEHRSGYFKDGRFTEMSDVLRHGAFTSIHQDRAGGMWFGGDHGFVHFKDGKAVQYTVEDGLPSDEIKLVHEDRNGTIWLATYGGLVEIKDGKFITYTEADGLVSNRVRTITEDADGTFWIGTYDGGISRFRDGKFTNFTTADGLFNNGAFRILEDARGNFWISSNRGIYRVSRAELSDFADGKLAAVTSIAYGTQDGMLNIECNGGRQPAGTKTRDGRLWFPTQQGVVVVDPQALPFNSSPPPVVIESIEIDNKPVSLNRPAIEIQPGQSNLEIAYTGLSLIKSDQVRFKYKLAGLDDEWIDAGTRRTAYFSYLPPGKYTFTVIAANSDGVWNTEGRSINVVVVPPFYRTWWFFTLSILVLVVLLTTAFGFRLNQLKRKHREQEAFSRRLLDSQEQERKRIAAELHDSLGQSLVIIKNRARLGLKDEDDAETMSNHLDGISSAASQALDEVKEISFNLRPYLLDKLGLTKTIKSMLGKVFSAGEIDLTAEIDDVDGVFSKESEILFYRIVQESANNIIKHAEATAVKVTIKHADGNLFLTIQDNGKGFDSSAQEKSANRSFGLIGIAERARLLGGAQSIISNIGQGTVVTVEIDLRNYNNER